MKSVTRSPIGIRYKLAPNIAFLIKKNGLDTSVLANTNSKDVYVVLTDLLSYFCLRTIQWPYILGPCK